MRVVVVDLDGTLCDHNWRKEHIATKNWEAYHQGIDRDLPHEDACDLVRMLSVTCTVAILTGRPERYRADTVRWLERHVVPFNKLFMRPDHDQAHDCVLKPGMLKAWLNDWHLSTHDVWFAIDDRTSVVQAYRSMGVNCWQVREGDY